MINANSARIAIYTKNNTDIQRVLSDAGSIISIADSIEALLNSIQQQKPKLIILDDIAVCKKIRQHHETVVLMLTKPDQFDAALDAGADDCIVMNERLLIKRAEQFLGLQSLQNVRAELQSFIDAVTDTIVILNRNGTYIDIKEDSNRENPLDIRPFLGKNLREFMPTDSADQILTLVHKTLDTGQAQYLEFLREKSPKMRWQRVMTSPLNENEVLLAVRDISEYRQAIQEANRQREIAEALLDTTNTLNASNDLNTVFDEILNNVRHVVPVESANIMILDEGIAQIIRHTGYIDAGFDEETISNVRFRLDDAPNLKWVVEHKVSLRIDDVPNSPTFKWAQSATEDYVKSILSAPIMTNGEVIGMINLDSTRVNNFTEEHAYHLFAFTNQAAIAMQRAGMIEKLHEYTDKLEKRVYERTSKLMQANAELKQQIRRRESIETKLEEERLLLRTLIDTIPDAIYVKDRERNFIMANQATVDNIDDIDTITQLLGKNDDELYPEIADITRQQENKIIQEGTQQFNQAEIYHNPDGTMTHLLVTKLPLYDSHGQITGLIGINHDITELRQAEAQLEQVLRSARCLLWSATVSLRDGAYDWNFQIANEQAAQGFLPLQLHNKTYTQAWLDAIPSAEQSKRQHNFETHLKFKQHNYTQEFPIHLSNDKQHWLSEDVIIREIADNRWQLVGVCIDITSRKLAEDQLHQLNINLEQRVEERTQQLTQSNQQLLDQIQERQRAEHAERQQRIIAETLKDNVATLSSTLDRDKVFDHLLNAIRSIVPHDAANIMLIKGNEVSIVRASGYYRDVVNTRYDLEGFEDLNKVLEEKDAFIIPDVRDFEAWNDPETAKWVRSNMSVPILLNDNVIGFLNIDSKQVNAFTEEHAKWMMTFGKQAGIAIRNARYTETLEQRVLTRTQDLELERAQLKAILDAMTDGVIYTDVKRQPYYINEALTNLSGYSQTEWLNGTAQSKMNESYSNQLDDVWQKVLRTLDTQSIWKGETELIRKDGTTLTAGLVRTEVRNNDDERIGIVTVIRDISEDKLLQQQKARFIATAAHELRTPIANMKTRLFLMKRKPEQFDQHVAVAENVTNLMQNLVEHMFDLSRFERGFIELNREDINLQELLHEIIQYQAPEAARRNISILLNMPEHTITLNADPFRLTQVIINLIGNALDYTPENTNVTLSVQNDDSRVHLTIEDNGQGIDAEHLPHLFQPFYRISENGKGAGLGLAIVHEIIKVHEGTIDVESEKGKGTCFHIHLPITEPELQS